jgi:excisionase family DNA binding protein
MELDNSAATASRTADSDLPLLLDASEAGQLLSISRVKVLDLASRREIPSIRIGRSIRIPRELLVAWIARTADGGEATAVPRLPNWAYVDRSEEL